MKGVVIAGTASGVGKTVATLAVIRGLQSAGNTVQPAKAGPDFIDPSHHETLTDQPSRTLDLWMQGAMGMRRNYYRGTGDICVVEGVMGLYDGTKSSTADIAETLDLPIILVIDASAGMESVAATAVGFDKYSDETGHDIDIVGIIAQKAHEGRHEQGIKQALPETLEYFGRIPPAEGLSIPERHLGLFLGEEAPIARETLDSAAASLHINRLVKTARSPPPPDQGSLPPRSNATVAVAADQAFSFIYPATIEYFRDHATLELFSPLNNDSVPDCDAMYLPGGYPELHASRLCKSDSLATIKQLAEDDLPVFAECGGMMVLADSLTTTDGERHQMAGVLPTTITMHDRYQALDHTAYTAMKSTLTASKSQSLRGHEFHYSQASPDADAKYAFRVDRGTGIDGEHEGLTVHRTLGTYGHIHPESGALDSFIANI